jgi:hypothetical protein
MERIDRELRSLGGPVPDINGMPKTWVSNDSTNQELRAMCLTEE